MCQAAIYNVALLEGYQGQQLGRKLIDSLLEQVKGCNVILYTHPKTVSMYEKMGFRRQKTGMAIYNGNAESLKWMEDIGFLLEEGYRFGDNDYERQHLADDNKDEIYGAISYPIYQSATFARDRVGGGSGYDYSRLQNPTREHLEKIVASLEEGIDALAFSTGMAAITALMEIFKPGDHIIIDEDLYGGSVRLFHSINVKNGLTFTSVDLSSVDVEDYIQDNTKAIYAETPTNPMMRVSDLEELAKKAKKHDLLLIVDNTFLSPYFQNPLKLGADIVVHSGTKYLGGHNDTLAGFLITNREDIQEQLRFIIKTTGATLAPMDSWLILRGIKTLGVRMDRAQENALKIAHFLEKQEYVTRVLYPGLESHPGYELMKKQARGFGSILTFEVDSKERAYHILENVKLIQFAESLGGTETLITYPITQTHADLSKEELDRNGITDRILRLSVGIEGAEDLIADLEAVLK